MNKTKTTKEEIISIAKNTKHYCELLIAQSEEWGERDASAGSATKKEKGYPLTINN